MPKKPSPVLRSALSTSFPGAEIDGCHFHFCQSIFRNFNQLGYKTEYEAITMKLNGRAARCPPASWNQTDRVETDLNRTNNYCESFNKTFSSVVGQAHPTIYNFLSAVHLEQASTEGKMHSYRRGVQPPKRKRRYLEKDTRLKHIVSTYHTYENNVAAYLDLLAQL